MARGRKVVFVSAAAVAVAWHLQQTSFVPPAGRRAASVAVPAVAAAALSAPAFADEIGDAAKKLSDAAYPFLKDVNWNSYAYLSRPGPATAGDWAKAIDKAIVMGAAMDPALVKKGVMAHHKAIASTSEANPVISKADFTEINAAIGRMIASVPEDKTMDVYNSFSNLVSKDVPPFLMSTVKEADAKAAYQALMDFKDVVKSHPITPKVADTPAALSAKLGSIDAAASKLAAGSYNFVKDIDWTSDLYLKPLPGVSPNQYLKAIDKALVVGASMDGKLLQQAAEAHHKAIGSMDDKLVTTQADWEAVNAALGKLFASVPVSQTMDVYNAATKLVNPAVGLNLLEKVNPNDAFQAYLAFLSFKDTVKAAI